jgi:hypothetical protein
MRLTRRGALRRRGLVRVVIDTVSGLAFRIPGVAAVTGGGARRNNPDLQAG